MGRMSERALRDYAFKVLKSEYGEREEKCELLRRRTNSIYDAFAAFNLRETVFDTVDEYQKEMNNKIRHMLAARK